MIHYTRQGDTVYPSSRYMEIAMCPNEEDAQLVCDALNATAGIPDPAAALKAARKALESTDRFLSGMIYDLNPHSDLARGDSPELDATNDQLVRVRAALNALKGEQP